METLDSAGSRSSPLEISPRTPGKSPAVRNLLVVDDETLMRWSLAERLSEAGFAVSEAADVEHALRLIESATLPIDLALLDYQLPDGDGVALLRSIRAQRPSCPVILMTAFGSPELTEEALRSGAFAIMDKPFELDALPVLIERALATTH